MLLNQWGNVVRWEKTTRPFLRTTEFLWQEGHTAHATEEEAEEEVRRMLEIYRDFLENELAIPVVAGEKSPREKFAGALRTYSLEALMRDGKVLQAGTSHNLGQHFAKVFEINYLDQAGQLQAVWQTSWGVSTRLIGALVMVHGDDRGLVFPPKIAPLQVVLVPILPPKERSAVLTRARQLEGTLKEFYRTALDAREEYTPGWKFNEWEMRGVPLRIEIGPRDLAKGEVVLVRRDTGEKVNVSQERLVEAVGEALGSIQDDLWRRASSFREENTRTAASRAELNGIMEGPRGLVGAGWCGDDRCEEEVKEKTGATIRNLPFHQQPVGACLNCGQPARFFVYFARAY
jgi:prolyl-tRNA synthetase